MRDLVTLQKHFLISSYLKHFISTSSGIRHEVGHKREFIVSLKFFGNLRAQKINRLSLYALENLISYIIQ